MLQTIAEGLRAAWADRTVRSMVILIAAFNFAFTGPMSVGLAVLADQQFAGGSAAFGLLLSAFGGGALIGAVVSGSVPRLPRLGTIFMVIAISLGIGLALIGLAPNLPVALAIIGAMGVLVGFINVQAIAWLQTRIPEELRGRIMSLVTLGSVGLAPVSLAIAGALVDIGAVTLMFVVAGGIVVAAAIAGIAWGVPVTGRLAQRGASRLGILRLGWLEARLDGIGQGQRVPREHQPDERHREGEDRRDQHRRRQEHEAGDEGKAGDAARLEEQDDHGQPQPGADRHACHALDRAGSARR